MMGRELVRILGLLTSAAIDQREFWPGAPAIPGRPTSPTNTNEPGRSDFGGVRGGPRQGSDAHDPQVAADSGESAARLKTGWNSVGPLRGPRIGYQSVTT